MHLLGPARGWALPRGEGVAKYERSAMKFVRRYLDEKEPTFKNPAEVVGELEARSRD